MTLLNFSDLIIPVNGIRLHAVSAGPESGPLIILLHGFPEFWYGWSSQIGSLANAGYRVIVPDQRGYNLSDKPDAVSAYVVNRLALDITGLIDYFGRETAVIAGHDWGAVVAWYLGIHYPERISRLIVVNVPHPDAMRQALQKPVWSQLRKSLYIFFFQIPFFPEWVFRRGNYSPLTRSLISTSLPGTFKPAELEQYIKAWSQPGALTGSINWYRALLRYGDRRDFQINRIVNSRVKVPTLVLWGDQDAFLEPFLADWSIQLVDNGQLVHFRDATHWVLHEIPDRVNEAILTFLENP